MRLHVIGLPHTITSERFACCAFTQKVLKFCKMMKNRGHYVIHYGHEYSDVVCDEHVTTITNEEWSAAYSNNDTNKYFYGYDTTNRAYEIFCDRAIKSISERKQPNDFLLPFWGSGVKSIYQAHSDMIVVEPGIGYDMVCDIIPYKVFESYAIYHAYRGLKSVGFCNQNWYEVVIPNYFDLNDFEYKNNKQDYLLFLGRVYSGKGIELAQEIAIKTNKKLIIAGQLANENSKVVVDHPNIEYVGSVGIEERNKLLSNAKALIAPSCYVEPFGGVQVEALLCGTPTITTDWGAFAENNVNGVTGYRCRTFKDFLDAVDNIDYIKPSVCREHGERFSTENVSVMYEKYFQDLLNLYTTKEGWYAL